jgi:RimJ/RimL family protein N-acetyltransferase
MAPRPPERIELDGGVVLVRNRPRHAEALAAAIGTSIEHLAPFMPWADAQAATAGFQRSRLTDGDGRWETGEEHVFLLVDPAETEVLGGLGLHRRIGPGAIEIGYWLRVDCTGRGLMTRAVAAVTAVAFALDDIDRVEVHTDTNNVASAAIPQRLGFESAGTIVREVLAPGEAGVQQVWVTTTPPWG